MKTERNLSGSYLHSKYFSPLNTRLKCSSSLVQLLQYFQLLFLRILQYIKIWIIYQFISHRKFVVHFGYNKHTEPQFFIHLIFPEIRFLCSLLWFILIVFFLSAVQNCTWLTKEESATRWIKKVGQMLRQMFMIKQNFTFNDINYNVRLKGNLLLKSSYKKERLSRFLMNET